MRIKMHGDLFVAKSYGYGPPWNGGSGISAWAHWDHLSLNLGVSLYKGHPMNGQETFFYLRLGLLFWVMSLKLSVNREAKKGTAK